MLTLERQEKILSLLTKHEVVKIQDLIAETGASESTIRRDLTELEQRNKLKRIHGGATLLQKMRDEPTIAQKTLKNRQEKIKIAKQAAELVQDGDCLFLDAGTTTYEMIPFLKGKQIVVVTNGLTNIASLLEAEIETHVLGGYAKKGTHAFVGRNAVEAIDAFRFDLVFLGTNGITPSDGYTTPDLEEAYIKVQALKRGRQTYVLVDHTKFGDVSFSKIADVERAAIITSSYTCEEHPELFSQLAAKTTIKVVER